MKSVFKNFSWKMMIAYTIVFGAISTIFDLYMGKYKAPNINISKTIASNIFMFIAFGFIMALVMGNKNAKRVNNK